MLQCMTAGFFFAVVTVALVFIAFFAVRSVFKPPKERRNDEVN